jgi:RNA polymerase sigma-70 factor, ECF subfamily
VPLTDIELMLRVQGGDVEAFRELFRRYHEPLRRYFAALLADRSLADDFVQETFLRLWLARSRYEPSGRFSTYLFQIGKHYWLNQRKKLYREVRVDAMEEAAAWPALTASQPEAVLLRRYREARIRRAVAALPEHYRTVCELSQFEGMKYAEIALRLGIPLGTVKSRMAEAMRRLRLAIACDDE